MLTGHRSTEAQEGGLKRSFANLAVDMSAAQAATRRPHIISDNVSSSPLGAEAALNLSMSPAKDVLGEVDALTSADLPIAGNGPCQKSEETTAQQRLT